MTETPPLSTQLGQDILCIGCGYNLRGLEPSGRCPECGLTIADSNRGDRLVFTDPAWLRKLRFGASLKLWNLIIGVLIGLVAGVLGAMGMPPSFVVLVGGIGGALGLWATFAITTQEPRTALTEDPVTLRKVIRACAVIAFVGLIGQQAVSGLRMTGSNPFSAPLALWILVSLVVSVAGMIVQIGELKYFRRFALRSPDPTLARSTRILMWGLAITSGLTSLMGVLGGIFLAPALIAMGGPATTTTTTNTPTGVTATVSATFPPGGTGFGATVPSAVLIGGACVFSAAAGLFGIWYVVLLVRYRKLFQNALSHAEGTA